MERIIRTGRKSSKIGTTYNMFSKGRKVRTIHKMKRGIRSYQS